MEVPDAESGFRHQVFTLVEQIPAGKVSTYGDIAAFIRPPADMDPDGFRRIGPRWVGRAMSAAPEGVPWHRVINSQGKISLPAGSRSATIQRMRLNAEGVEFNDRGRVDLGRFGWRGPDAQWLEENDYLPASVERPARPVQLGLFGDSTDDH